MGKENPTTTSANGNKAVSSTSPALGKNNLLSVKAATTTPIITSNTPNM
jgi:hypothetical protein